MIDIIEALSEDEDYMTRFCRDCPAGRDCPADFEPFCNNGCVKTSEIERIEAAVTEAEAVMEEAVA
jgi:hypothetical protein